MYCATTLIYFLAFEYHYLLQWKKASYGISKQNDPVDQRSVEERPIEDTDQEEEMNVKEESEYASVVTSSLAMHSPITEDLTVQYQNTATKVS